MRPPQELRHPAGIARSWPRRATREELGAAVATRSAIPHVYTSAEEMLASERLDGLVASQPFDRHGVLVPELLKAGLPIFTEKPSAWLEVGERIARAVEASGTWHMVGYHKRSDPATMAAKAEIERLKESGELGKLDVCPHPDARR